MPFGKRKKKRKDVTVFRFTEEAWNRLYGHNARIKERWEEINRPDSVLSFAIPAAYTASRPRFPHRREKQAEYARIVTIDDEFLTWVGDRAGMLNSLLKKYAASLSDVELNRLHRKNGMTKNYLAYEIRILVGECPETNAFNVPSRDRFLEKLRELNPGQDLWIPRIFRTEMDRGSQKLLMEIANQYFEQGLEIFSVSDIHGDGQGDRIIGLPILTRGEPMEDAIVPLGEVPWGMGLDIPRKELKDLLRETGFALSGQPDSMAGSCVL